MHPALAPIPPLALKEILVQYGFRILFEDEYNWILDEPDQPTIEPIVIPKIGEVVAVDVMMDTIINARMAYGTYFALKEKVLGKNWGYPPSPSAETEQTKPN
jgi:hypothetical protein